MNETWAGIPRSPKLKNQWPMVKCQTRMYSSRMRTARLLTVSRSVYPGGGCVPTERGVCPGGCLPRRCVCPDTPTPRPEADTPWAKGRWQTPPPGPDACENITFTNYVWGRQKNATLSIARECRQTVLGEEYRGTTNVTQNGIQC